MSVRTGSKLKELRSLLKVTQAQMAERVGVTDQTIKMLENGSHEPSIQTARKIAAAYGTTVDALFPSEDAV